MAEKKLALAFALAALALVHFVFPVVGKPPAHLVPFPEDEAESRVAQAKPSKPPAPRSEFKPRFKVPDVKQVEHLEPASEARATDQQPADATAADEPAGEEPQLLVGAESAETSGPRGREALDAAYTKSKSAASEGEYTEVIELCDRARADRISKTYQDYAVQLMGWAYNRRGEVRATEGREAEALADFEAAVAAGGAWRAIHNRGVGYAAAGRDQEARADFDRAITINPQFALAYFHRGEVRSKLGDQPGAIEDYSMAIRLGPPEPSMYVGRGHAFYQMQRFGDALRDYGEAIKLDPENVAALVNRGDTYSDLGKYGEAAKDYRAAVRLAPKNGRAFQAAAWLMATCPDAHYRDDELAVDAAKQAIELDGPTYRNLTTLAAAQAGAGLFQEARQTQEQAISAAPKEDLVTAEKMMSLYRREIAFRDRPFTAFTPPEEMNEEQVRQATATEPIGPGRTTPPGRRAWYQTPNTQPGGFQPPPQRLPPSQIPGQPQPPQQQPKARLFAPRGRI